MESLYDEIKIADEHTPTSIGIIYIFLIFFPKCFGLHLEWNHQLTNFVKTNFPLSILIFDRLISKLILLLPNQNAWDISFLQNSLTDVKTFFT